MGKLHIWTLMAVFLVSAILGDAVNYAIGASRLLTVSCMHLGCFCCLFSVILASDVYLRSVQFWASNRYSQHML